MAVKPNPFAPVLSTDMVEQLEEMLMNLSIAPECTFLTDYFMGRVVHGRTAFYPLDKDYDNIRALFPSLAVYPPNINQILMYYITGYPSFDVLRAEYLSDKAASKPKLRQWYKEFYCFIKIKLDALPEVLEFIDNKCFPTPAVLEYTSKYSGDFFKELPVMESMQTCTTIMPSANDKNIERPGSFKALLNYPWFEVTLNLGKVEPLISLTRTFDGVYHRFLAANYEEDQKSAIKKVALGKTYSKVFPNNIQTVDFLVDPDDALSYTYETVKKYVKDLVKLMNLCKTRVPHQRKQDIRTILIEFLADINEMNFGIATGTKVTYVLNNKYFQRKLYAHHAHYIETLCPTIALTLRSFNPVTALSARNRYYFKQLQIYSEIPSLFEDMLLDAGTLSYRCTRCDVSFTTSDAVLKHFQEQHVADVGVLCPNCEEGIGVNTLAERRWTHTCPK